MTYYEIMQKPGKRIHPKFYYYNSTNTKVEIDRDDINSVKLYYNAPLTGSVMLGLDAELKYELPDVAIYFQNTATYNGTNATKTYGPFYLKEKPSFNASSKVYEHTMYDGFLKAMIDYQPITITYPTTVLDFFKQLCLECGYTTNITSLPNSSRTITMDIYEGINFTYRDVFDDIANATGSLFRCNNNVIEKCSLGTSAITVDDDLLKNQNIDLGEHFGPINCVVLSRSGGADNIYKRDETLTSWNEYKIVDNQLMNDNNRSDYLDELYTALYGIEYDIFDLELVGYGGFNPLDKVSIITNNTTYTSYVFNNEIKFTQGVEECIYTEMPEESTTDYTAASTTDKKINQTYIIANKNTQQIQSVVSQIGDRSEKSTTITQDIDTISQQISQVADLTKEETQNSALEIEDAIASDLIKFSIVGEMSLLYPRDDLYPSNDLYPLDSFLIIEDEEGNQNKLWLPLTYLHYWNANVYDEFVVENGQAKIIRRVGVNDDGSFYALTTPTEEDKGELNIPISTGYNKIWLESFFDKTLKYYAKYGTESDLTEVFATKVEMNSAITQTANSINLEVSKKVDEDEVIAAINLTSEEAKINAEKITLEGTVTANENFKVLEDGSIEAVNGKFTGNIYLEDGNVVVGGDGLLTNLKFTSTGIYDGKSFVGFRFDTEGGSMNFYKTGIALNFIIPDNFTVTNAYVTLAHSRVNFFQMGGGEVIGYCRNVKLYKTNGNQSAKIYSTAHATSGYTQVGQLSGNEIPSAFGANGYTASNSNSDTTEIVRSIDIKNYISNGNNTLFINTTDSTSSTQMDTSDANSKTGAIQMTIDVIGYMSF